MAKVVASMLMGLFLVGCASGHCRGRDNISEAAKLKWQDEEALKKQKAQRVFVFKHDGSQQCGMGQSIKPETMAKDLKDLQIFSMDNQSDGLMRIQACGTPTGRINVFEIQALDLEKATKAGFRELKKK